MLYSLNAITTYGHSDVALSGHWQLMGALEALNGMLLFGLSTAFLYGILQRVWPSAPRGTLSEGPRLSLSAELAARGSLWTTLTIRPRWLRAARSES